MLINNFIKKEGRALPVFILLDVSGSMGGEKIETVNIAFDSFSKYNYNILLYQEYVVYSSI